MSPTKERVVIAMSGGVDSSVSAALLVEQGYDVMGLMMRLWSEPGQFSKSRDNRCCTRDQMLDAHFVARKLGISFEVVDAVDTFKQNVVDPFIDSYNRGLTPNPCLACNRHIRFTFLLQEALNRGAAYLATGHYAQVSQADDGTYELHRGADPAKDQSYVLSVLTQEQLKHSMFPVGGYTKPEVRKLAEGFGLPVASKGDSQDLCFVADGDYRRFLRAYDAEGSHPGDIKLRSGEVLGQHEGLPAYTIGQRKGLGISWQEPLYVLEKDVRTNTLVVGPRSEMGRDRLHAANVNWLEGRPPADEIRAQIKIRYKSRFAPGTVTPLGEDAVSIRFDDPLPDITPGQGAVIYIDDRVVGSGIITDDDGISAPPAR